MIARLHMPVGWRDNRDLRGLQSPRFMSGNRRLKLWAHSLPDLDVVTKPNRAVADLNPAAAFPSSTIFSGI